MLTTNAPDTDSATPLQSVADLVEIAGALPASAVLVAGGDRVEDLRLVESARDHGIIDRILLVGQPDRIEKAVAEVGIEVPSEDIITAPDDKTVARTTVELVKAGGIDIVLKGNISTPIINRQMLQLAVRPTVSLASIFDASPISGGRPMILTDAGVTTVCNFGRLVNIIDNAVDLARRVMRIERPRVAILSANEKQIASLKSTWLGAKLSERTWPNAIVHGPLSFDLATDPGSVAIKGLTGGAALREVAGQADVLVCPGIDSANVLYKTITAMIKYGQASLAGITVGFQVPYIILSRADTLSTRLESIALCSIYAHRPDTAETVQPAEITTKQDSHRVLVVNPGSTSIKTAIYEDETCVFEQEVACDAPVLNTRAERERHAEILTQSLLDLLKEHKADPVDAVAGRGGFIPRAAGKLAGGVYVVAERKSEDIVVDESLRAALLDAPERDHASNAGIPVAAALATTLGVPAFTVDPVVVDEFSPEAELSGYAAITRQSTSHALSIRAAAQRAAREIGRPVEDMALVIAHLGGGITVAAMRNGKMIDNTIALLGGGPFTPQRAGQLPLGSLIDLCYSSQYTREELIEELTKRGGLKSYLGEHRMEVIEQRITEGDEQAKCIVDAMVYQISKEIGAMVVAAGCDVEAIVLTGGLARSALVRSGIRRRVVRLAPVMIYPGSLEMAALAAGAIDALTGKTEPQRYIPPSSGDTHHE